MAATIPPASSGKLPNTADNNNNEEQDQTELEQDISIFAKSQLKMKLRCNEQTQASPPLDFRGCPTHDEFQNFEFLTSHFHDKVDFQLQITQLDWAAAGGKNNPLLAAALEQRRSNNNNKDNNNKAKKK